MFFLYTFHRMMICIPSPSIKMSSKNLLKALSDYQEKRNDFWNVYGQLLIAVTIAGLITVLLLTKTITDEAGLPILSAIAGFAIAKNSNSRSIFTGGNEVIRADI